MKTFSKWQKEVEDRLGELDRLIKQRTDDLSERSEFIFGRVDVVEKKIESIRLPTYYAFKTNLNKRSGVDRRGTWVIGDYDNGGLRRGERRKK